MVLIKQEDVCNVASWGKKGEEYQKKIAETSVLVVGSDILAQKVLSCLIGLGFGRISLVDNKEINKNDKKYFLYFKKGKEKKSKKDRSYMHQSRVKHIAKTLEAIKEVKIEPYHSCFVKTLVSWKIKPKKSNKFIIINASNDYFSKEECVFYSKRYHVPFIAVSSDDYSARLTCYHNRKIFGSKPDLESLIHEDFVDKEQGTFTSSIIAGLAAEEAKKYTIRLDDNLDKNLRSNKSLDYKSGLNSIPNLKKKKVLVVGAGGIGTFVALDLVLLDTGYIDVIDQDTIKNKNLNRQIFYYNAAGQRKAKILSERLRKINKSVICNGIYGSVGSYKLKNVDKDLKLVTEKEILSKDYDIIFGCVDNIKTRIFLDKVSQEYSIPYIDGAVSSSTCSVENYIPGFSEPIGQQADLNRLLPEKDNSSGGCVEEINPSIINPNIIAGGVMVNRFLNLCNNQPNKKKFKYNSYSSNRFEEV